MKRFLSLFAIVALIVSMFSGVAFAAADEVYVDLNYDTITFGDGFNTVELSGKILASDTNALYKADAVLKIYKDLDGSGTLEDDEKDGILDGSNALPDTPLYTVTADDGAFKITIATDASNTYEDDADPIDDERYDDSTGVGNYIIVGEDAAWAFTKDGSPDNAVDTFVIVNAIEIAQPEALEYEYPVSGQKVIQGVFTNEDGDANDDITLAYQADFDATDAVNSSVAVADFNDDESFGFLFNGSVLDKEGDIGIYINGVLAVEGKVSPKALDVTISPEEAPKALGYQTLTFDFDIDKDKYISGNNLVADHVLRFSVTDEDGDLVKADKNDNNDDFDDTDDLSNVVLSNETSGNFVDNDTDKQKIDYDLYCGSWEPGTYTFTVQLFNDGSGSTPATVILEKEIDIKIKNPSTYTVISWGHDEDTVGNVIIQFPDDTGSDLDDNVEVPVFGVNGPTEEQQLYVTKYSNGNKTYPKYFEITANGCGLEDKKYANFGLNKVTPVDTTNEMYAEIKASETGELELEISAYFDNGSGEPESSAAYTFKKTIEIKGWNVDVTPTELIVGSEETITITITDEEGNPVNNAKIEIAGTVVIDGSSTNIIGGVYTYEDDDENLFDNVGKLDVEAFLGTTSKVNLQEEIEVIGEEVYSVATDTPVMINGLNQDIYVTVLDENGDIVYPSFDAIYVDSDGDKSDAITVTGSTRKDLDDDGVKEAIKLDITPTASDVELIIRATTDGGDKMGEVSIELQKPQVVMTGVEKLTENFEQTLEFTLVDPRDNSVINNSIYFTGNLEYVLYELADEDDAVIGVDGEMDANPGQSNSVDADDDDVYTYKVFVNDVDWDKLEKDEKDAEINVYVELDNNVKVLTIPIGKAKLTSDPENMIMGTATNLTFTYVDADGNPLEGYDIDLGDDEIGETDENGQVVYSTSSSTSVSLTFKADTDDSTEDANTVSNPHEDNSDSTKTSLKIKSAADVQAPTATYELNGNTAIITITDNVRIVKAMVNGELVDMFFPMPTATHVVTGLKTGENKVEVLAGDINNNFLQTTLVITVEATAEPVSFTLGQDTEYGKPVKVEETTMVPVRFAEQLGATVAWDPETVTVTYTLGETSISMTIGSKTAIVNGENVQLPVAPFKNDLGRTMVPVRMIATELGFTVNYVSDDAPITIE